MLIVTFKTRITNSIAHNLLMISELKISNLKKCPRSIEKIIPKKTITSPKNHEMLRLDLFKKKEYKKRDEKTNNKNWYLNNPIFNSDK